MKNYHPITNRLCHVCMKHPVNMRTSKYGVCMQCVMNLETQYPPNSEELKSARAYLLAFKKEYLARARGA